MQERRNVKRKTAERLTYWSCPKCGRCKDFRYYLHDHLVLMGEDARLSFNSEQSEAST